MWPSYFIFFALTASFTGLQSEEVISINDGGMLIESMESLVQSEKTLLEPLKLLINSDSEKFSAYKGFEKQVNDAHEYMEENGLEKFLANPLNNYSLLNRLMKQWKMLQGKMTDDSPAEKDLFAKINHVQFPGQEDLKGAMETLLLLQNTYKLPTKKLAQGVMPGINGIYSQSLDLSQIYDMGVHAHNMNDWYYAKEWMRAALSAMISKRDLWGIDRYNILDILAFCEYKNGNLRQAISLTKQLISLRPELPQLKKNLEFYQADISTVRNSKKSPKKQKKEVQLTEEKLYQKLCRGEVRKQTTYEMKKMKCWYKRNHALLILKPQKVERVWPSPEVLQFHQLLTDKQVTLIKDMAQPNLQLPTMVGRDREMLKDNYRLSRTAWLQPSNHQFLKGMAARVEACTDLDMNSAEALQVIKYGMNGHYHPHLDYDTKFDVENWGNRIATLLYHLSDVSLGGATVFTKGGGAVFPKKGDAIFWYNLKRNGDGDQMTMHAGCPVLVGQKWISTWCIRERGQEMRRRCSLDRNE